MSAMDAIGRNAYYAGIEAGLTHEQANEAAKAARAKARATLAQDDPARATINGLQKRLGQVSQENLRLHREREALIRALADALKVDEPTALSIARLDVEEDEKGK